MKKRKRKITVHGHHRCAAAFLCYCKVSEVLEYEGDFRGLKIPA